MTLQNPSAPTFTLNKHPLEREDIIYLVRKWGDLNTDGILDSSCEIFSHPEIEGLIGYRIRSGNAVVFGDPICAPEDKPALALAFQNFCKDKRLGVVYTIASEEFEQWAVPALSAVGIEFGLKLVLDPTNNPMNKTGSKAGLVRKKVKHALSEGFVVEEYTDNDPQKQQAIENVANQWLDGRSGPQVYLARVTLFEARTGKRWFYAQKGDLIVGILLLNELKAQDGWLLNNLMITKEAPNGISELLVITALQMVEKENCRRVIVGPIPAKSLGNISGMGMFWSKIARLAYNFANKMFRLDGGVVFWEKFQPQSEKTFVLFPKKNIGFSSVKGLLNAYHARIR